MIKTHNKKIDHCMHNRYNMSVSDSKPQAAMSVCIGKEYTPAEDRMQVEDADENK